MIDPAEIMVGTMYGPLRPLRVCKDQIRFFVCLELYQHQINCFFFVLVLEYMIVVGITQKLFEK